MSRRRKARPPSRRTTMRTERAAKPQDCPRTTRTTRTGAGAGGVRVVGVVRGLIACGAVAMPAGAAIAQPAPPLIHEPAVVAPGFDATMLVVNIPPAGDGPLTTAGQAGDRHPGSTYAYVCQGAVIQPLGDRAEERLSSRHGSAGTPGQPHHIL